MTAPPKAGNELGELVRLTFSTIERRAAYYRNTVVAVAVLTMVCPLLALIAWSWRPLLGLVLLGPVTGVFLWLDAGLVAAWQGSVLRSWSTGAVQLSELQTALQALRHLPASTVEGMLATLTTGVRRSDLDGLPIDVRPGLASSATNEMKRRQTSLGLSAGGLLLCAGFVLAFAMLGRRGE